MRSETLLLLGVLGCSKGISEADRRAQIVAAINGVPMDQMGPPLEWPKPCSGIHEATMPGDKQTCSMTDEQRAKFRDTATDRLREGLLAVVNECGHHRNQIADRISANRAYSTGLVSDSTRLLLPTDHEQAFRYASAELRQSVKRALVTCFGSETVGTNDVAWIATEKFEALVTLDDLDMVHVAGLDPKAARAALDKQLTAPGS